MRESREPGADDDLDLTVRGAGTSAERLFVLAGRLFREKGFAGTTTRELSSGLGLQNASLYHHIRSKEHLLFRLCLSALDDVSSTFAAALDEPDPLTSLRVLFRRYVELILNDRDRHAVMLLELRWLTPAHRSEVVAARDGNVAMVRERIHAAQQAGQLRADTPARLMVLALFNIANWSIFWFNEGGDQTAGEVAVHLERLFFAGSLNGHDLPPMAPVLLGDATSAGGGL